LKIRAILCSASNTSQRWKVQTTMSVAKRKKWGESLSAPCEELQKAQLLLRGVTYNNLHQLVLLGIFVAGRTWRGTPYLPESAVFYQGFRQSKPGLLKRKP